MKINIHRKRTILSIQVDGVSIGYVRKYLSNTEKLIYILNAEIAKQILEFQKAREKLKLHVQSANTL